MNILGSLLGTAHREPAGVVIEVGEPYDDTDVKPLYPGLREVTVEIARSKAGEAHITFSSRRGQDGSWDVEDSGVFVEWKPVRISAAFGLLSREEVMRGAIREIRIQHPENLAESTVNITVQDLSLMADREHRREVWGQPDGTTDQTLVRTVLERNRLDLDSNSQEGLTGIHVNQDGTDAALLRARAEANGYELLYEGTGVYFGSLHSRMSGPPSQEPIRVGAGSDTNCLSVDIEVDGRKPDVVVLQFANSQNQSAEEVRKTPSLPLLGQQATHSSGPGDLSVQQSASGSDRAELEKRAQAQADQFSLKVKASGELDGTLYGHVMRVGHTVRLDGVGPRMSGSYLVDTVSHRFSTEGYRQRFTLLRNAFMDGGDNPLLSAISAVLGS